MWITPTPLAASDSADGRVDRQPLYLCSFLGYFVAGYLLYARDCRPRLGLQQGLKGAQNLLPASVHL